MNKLFTGRNESKEVTLQAVHKSAITPSDSTDLSRIMFLYMPAEGVVAFTLEGDTDSSAPTGITLTAGYHPLCVKKVWATNTTAATIIGYY